MAENELFSGFIKRYEEHRELEMSLEDYLRGCRNDPLMFASAPERLLAAIGEPKLIDTAQDQRLGRVLRVIIRAMVAGSV